MVNREPDPAIGDLTELLLGQLDYYRAVVIDKLRGLGDRSLTTSSLPSGWTPIGLLHHLESMERRWLEWGFEGRALADPWRDDDGAGGWVAVATPPGGPDVVLDHWAGVLAARGERTRRVSTATSLSTRAALGGRFDRDPPTLGWILLHVLQEYARHAGHADILRELVDGQVGE